MNEKVLFRGKFKHLIEFSKELKNNKNHFIYGIEYAPNKTKIGRTKNPKNRFQTYLNNFELYLNDTNDILSILFGGFEENKRCNIIDLERNLQKQIQKDFKPVRGKEWFYMNLDDLVNAFSKLNFLNNEYNENSESISFKISSAINFEIDQICKKNGHTKEIFGDAAIKYYLNYLKKIKPQSPTT